MNCGRLWKKTLHHCLPEELEVGDCWLGVSLAHLSGLILYGRVGKHSDSLAQELVISTQSKTDCFEWHTDSWGGYERALCDDDDHYVSKALTQPSERTNDTLPQQTGRTASPTKQLWQVVEPDKSHLALSHQLLQLDLAAFMLGNYRREREQG